MTTDAGHPSERSTIKPMNWFRRLFDGGLRSAEEEIIDIFHRGADGSDGALDRAAAWATAVLDRAGVEPTRRIRAASELRRADPRLGQKAAEALVDRLVSAPPAD